jgi:chemotaxis protein CheC
MHTELQEINQKAADSASIALSKLMKKPLKVAVAKAEMREIISLSPVLGLEEIAAGIYLPVSGDVKGAALLIFPRETAFNMCDMMLGREPDTTRKLTDLDESALKEVGNIISGSYFTVMANRLKIKIIEHLPMLSFDMFGAILNQIIIKFAKETEKALVIELEFDFHPLTLKGYFMILFSLNEFQPILDDMASNGS